MTNDVEAANQRARAAAERAGRPTYHHQVVTGWTGCTVCGKPIQHNVDVPRPGVWRSCGCPGVLWRTVVGGWDRVEMMGDV